MTSGSSSAPRVASTTYAPPFGALPQRAHVPPPPPLPTVTPPAARTGEKAMGVLAWVFLALQVATSVLAIMSAGDFTAARAGAALMASLGGLPFWLIAAIFVLVCHVRRSARKSSHAQEQQARTAASEYNDRAYRDALARAAEEFDKAVDRQKRIDELLPLGVASQQVFGAPGRGLSVGRFGSAATAGRDGEQRTVDALAPVLTAHPAARLVNGLRWPGTDHADIDHALLLGERMAVIDSKRWKTGHYYWDGQKLYLNGEESHEIKVPAAARALATEVPTPARNLACWVVVHGEEGLTIENAGENLAARVVTPDALVSELMDWLAGSEEVVDRWRLLWLLDLMVDEPTVLRT